MHGGGKRSSEQLKTKYHHEKQRTSKIQQAGPGNSAPWKRKSGLRPNSGPFD
jgi:hypothetical protein